MDLAAYNKNNSSNFLQQSSANGTIFLKNSFWTKTFFLVEFPSSKYPFQYFLGKGQTMIKLRANQSVLVNEIYFYSWDFINKRKLLALSPKLNEI